MTAPSPQLLHWDGCREGKENSSFHWALQGFLSLGLCWVGILLSGPCLGLVASSALLKVSFPWDLLLFLENSKHFGAGFPEPSHGPAWAPAKSSVPIPVGLFLLLPERLEGKSLDVLATIFFCSKRIGAPPGCPARWKSKPTGLWVRRAHLSGMDFSFSWGQDEEGDQLCAEMGRMGMVMVGRELLARTKRGRQGAGCGWHGTARLGTAAVSPCTLGQGSTGWWLGCHLGRRAPCWLSVSGCWTPQT